MSCARLLGQKLVDDVITHASQEVQERAPQR